jgi:hypothetical protein
MLRKALDVMFYRQPDPEAQDALVNVEREHAAAQIRKGRADIVVNAIENRVYQQNHIAEAIQAFWSAGGKHKS